MRKINAILVLIIVILLLDHVIFGGLYLFGAGTGVIKPLALSLLILVAVHAVISMIITIRAEKAGMKTKARYNKENREFWGRRVSGMFIIILAFVHAFLMSKNAQGVPRMASAPKPLRLATPLLIISVFAHLKSNVRPLLIAMGVRNIDKKQKIATIILYIIFIFALSGSIFTVISHMRRK